ncbi:MAG: hypothetical protein ABL925_17715 [Methylococcales bacterium]
MKQMVITYTSLILLLASSSTFAEEARSLKQIQQLESLGKLKQTLDQFEASLDSFIDQREIDCAKAVGYKPFCACINKDLPVAWSFSDYVAIATKSKEENQYGKMDKDHQEAYEKVIPIRDKCVYEINKL